QVLHLDDLGAQLGELQRAERAGAVLFDREDAQSLQQFRAHVLTRKDRFATTTTLSSCLMPMVLIVTTPRCAFARERRFSTISVIARSSSPTNARSGNVIDSQPRLAIACW